MSGLSKNRPWIRRWVPPVLLLLSLLPGLALAGQTTTQPFVGVTYIARTETSPRPLRMHVVLIDLKAPGIRFMVTPPTGRLETVKQTTLRFLTSHKAQIAINAHFFSPWPPPKGDKGEADLHGLAASCGQVYSSFVGRAATQPTTQPASRSGGGYDCVALNIDAHNHVTIVHRKVADPTGRSVVEPVTLYNVVAGNEQILTAGAVTASASKTLNPRTVIGLAPGDKLVLFVVDGRIKAVSEGMTMREMADLLRRDYGVTDAINLDGGGSTTLCLADPKPRVVNGPVALGLSKTLRSVGSSLAVFATPNPAGAKPREATTQPATPRPGRP